MDFVFGYLAGLLTLINPCVLPILPIVLASACQTSRWGPVALAAGLSVSFVTLGMLVTTVGYSIGLTEEVVSQVAAMLMIGFGLVMIVPQFSERFATATAGFAESADAQFDHLDQRGLGGQFLGGMLLGAVWTPCVGPTLGAAIGWASQGENLGQAFGIMVAFAMGISTIILALGFGARSAIQKRQAWMRTIAHKGKPILGGVFILVGVGILLKLHHAVEIWVLDTLPHWFTDLSVAL